MFLGPGGCPAVGVLAWHLVESGDFLASYKVPESHQECPTCTLLLLETKTNQQMNKRSSAGSSHEQPHWPTGQAQKVPENSAAREAALVVRPRNPQENGSFWLRNCIPEDWDPAAEWRDRRVTEDGSVFLCHTPPSLVDTRHRTNP